MASSYERSSWQASPQDLANKRRLLPRVNEHGLQVLVWAWFAGLRFRSGPGLQDLANCTWSLARPGVVCMSSVESIAARPLDSPPAPSTQDVINMAQGFNTALAWGRKEQALFEEALQPLVINGQKHSLDWAIRKVSHAPLDALATGPR